MRWIVYAGLILACCAVLEAGTVRMNPEAFAEAWSGGHFSFSSCIEELPMNRFISLRDGVLRLENYPGIGVQMMVLAHYVTAGPVKVRIHGRTLAGKPAPTFELGIVGYHDDTANCAQVHSLPSFTLPFELKSDKNDSVELSFDLDSAVFKCKQCGEPLIACLFTGSLRLSPKWNGEPPGLEITGIEFVTPYPSYEHVKSLEDRALPVLFREEAARLEALRQKHLAVLRDIRPDNRFNAESFSDFAPAGRADQIGWYFTPEELSKLNPEFEIRRIASWPFYDYDDWTPYATELYGLPDVERIFVRNGVIYATGYGYFARWDATASRWDYITDKSVFSSQHRPVKTFPGEEHNVYLKQGKLYRLSDGAEIPFPADAAKSSWESGQYTVTGGKVYWIAGTHMSIYVADPDFSNPKKLEFTPPEDVYLGWITAIFAAENNGTLLIQHYARINNRSVPRCVELNLSDRSCRVKLPEMQMGQELRGFGNGWIFYSGGGQLLDPGKGKPFVTWKGSSCLNFPQVGLTRCKATADLEHAVRVGPYLVIGKTYPGQLYFLNLFDPRNSLKLNGFYHYCSFEAIPGGEGIWVIMPDGLYEVRPKTLPPLPELVMPKIEKESIPSLSLAEVIGEVTSDAPALFDGELKGDAGFVMTLRPMAARTTLEVGVKLPGKGDGKTCWLFRFAGGGNANFNQLFQEIELVGDDGVRFMQVHQNSKTLYVPADVTLIRFVSGPSEKSRTVVLKEITLTKNPLKESKK